MNRGLKLGRRLTAGTAALGLLAGTGLVVTPAAMQRRAGASRQTVNVNGHPAAPGEVLVKFRRSLAASERGGLDQQADADRDEALGRGGVRRMHSRRGDTPALLAFLQTHPDVEYAEPNYIVRADATPDDTNFGQLWGLFNWGQVVGVPGTPGADIEAKSAWDVSTGSAATVVAIIDTGIEYTHNDLAQNIWSAPIPFTVNIGNRTIACAAGTHGFNAITSTCDPRDDFGHGTHVSGTIGAAGNNHVGVVGVNWTVRMMAAKALDATGSGTVADSINAIEFVIQAAAATGANVRVLSNSWSSGGFSQALLDEINKADASNMLFVASAGNNGANSDISPHYPASYTAPNVIAVAATNNTDTLLNSSNYGPTSVHLAAPGANILSTFLNNTYQYLSGTSMAAPHVSGAAALILSSCALDTAALKNNLLNSVDPIPLLAGRLVTGGRLNVNTAIRACNVPPDFSVSAVPSTHIETPTPIINYTVTVTPLAGFTGAVTFSVSGLPSGATSSFDPPAITASGSSTMTITSSPATPTGSFPLTITGTSGSLLRIVSVTLILSAPTITTNVASSNNPSTFGAGVTFTATVGGSGALTGTVTFLDGTTTLGSASLDLNGQATLTMSSLGAGTHPITAVYIGTGSLDGSTSASLSHVVTRAPLTVAATSQTKTYGVANPALTVSYSGFVNGDTTVALTAPATASTPATAASAVGTYPITASGAASANYTIDYVTGQLTVTPAVLTATAISQTKTYGTANPPLTVSYSGFVNGDTEASLTALATVSTPATAASTAGTYPVTASGASSTNYTTSYVTGQLMVTPAALTVTAANRTKAYGAVNPALTVSYSGFVNGDTAASLTVLATASTPATAASAVGTYPITPSGAASANYTIEYVNGSLTVTAAALTVTATNQTKTYGAANPALTVSYSGFVNGDTATSLTAGPTVSTPTMPSSAVATYPIAVSGAVSANYSISHVNGLLTVTPAALTVTADSKTKAYGAPNPLLTVSYTGFVSGDTVASLTTPATVSTPATTGSAAGTYPITPAGVASVNYIVDYVNGTLTVMPNNRAVANDQNIVAVEDTPVPITLTASDVDSPALNYSVVAGPSHGTLDGTAPNVTYTPTLNFSGADTFTFKANDGSLDSNIAVVVITVTAVDDAPVAVNDSYTTDEDTPLTVAAAGVLANDTDIDSATLTAIVVVGPAHGLLTLDVSGSFTYTPAANYNGGDSFTYRANDGSLNSNIATVAITIKSVDDAPVSVNDSYATPEDTPLMIAAPGVLVNDSDNDSVTLTAIVVAGPAHGSLTLNANGSFTYTATANYSGADSFTYKANDGILSSNVATVSIAVSAVNDPPVANNDTATTTEDRAVSGNVLANDTDADPGSALTASLVAGPAHGTVILSPNGGFVYTPNLNFAGGDAFVYAANDGIASSNSATVTISVTAVNDAPGFSRGADQTVNEDAGPQSIVAWAVGITAGPPDDSGQAITFLVSNNANGLFSAPPAIAANGTLTYTPAANANGSATVVVQVHDDGGTANGGVDTSVAQTFTITVLAVNDAPAFTKGANQTVAQGAGAQTIPNWATAISAGPGSESAQALNFIVSNSNNALFAVQPALSATGTLTYTPVSGASGSAIITVALHDNGGTANDGVDTSAPQTFTVTGAAPGTLSVSDASVVEGNSGTTPLVFTVTLSAPSSVAVSVSYTTLNGTASSRDYEATSGTLTFAAGETSRTITVLVTGDTNRENTETLTLRLSNAINAAITRANGMGTIIDND